jgi:hypothetical protein
LSEDFQRLSILEGIWKTFKVICFLRGGGGNWSIVRRCLIMLEDEAVNTEVRKQIGK